MIVRRHFKPGLKCCRIRGEKTSDDKMRVLKGVLTEKAE